MERAGGHDWAPWALWLAVQYRCPLLLSIAHEILYCPCEVLYGLLNIAHLVANVPIIWDPYVPPMPSAPTVCFAHL